jgi:hypothetical protein
MIKRLSMVFYGVLFTHLLIWGQATTNLTSLPKIIPQSPNTAAFKKFGDIPVSYYTGVPEISVPLYNISVDNINLPISLSYHASGIKVADEAGRTGLGWALVAASSITRTIRGEDDFQHSIDAIYSYHSPTNPAPELMLKGKNYAELYPILNDDHGLREITIGRSEASKSKIYPGIDMTTVYNQVNLYDMEPDLYQFNFPGLSGKFILKHNKEVILEKKSNIKIECIGANADSWVITSPDGTKYYFEQIETFKDNPQGIIFTRRTAWHITKIVTTNNKEILFTYTNQTLNTATVGNVSQYKSDCSTCGNLEIPYTLTISGSREYQVPLLDEINFENGRVVFTYDNNRDDIQDFKFNQVEIFSKDGDVYKSIKKWQLNYEYFNGTSDVSYNIGLTGVPVNQYYKRLKLKSVVEKAGVNSLPPYEFTYNNESGDAPSKASFARDHYGYYNGKQNKSNLIPEFSGVTCTGVL